MGVLWDVGQNLLGTSCKDSDLSDEGHTCLQLTAFPEVIFGVVYNIPSDHSVYDNITGA